MAVDSAAAARWVVRRRDRRRERLCHRLHTAQRDAGRIISVIAEEYRPRRIYQWGSLVHTERFSEMSDIDIAIEGMDCDERVLSSIRSQAELMTDLPVDLVVMERLEPGRANLIRRFGTVVWHNGDTA
jgi:predicted nucleotidyltransferase